MILKSIFNVFLLLCVLTFLACDSGSDDPAVTETERVTNLLIGNSSIGTQWTLSSVSVNDIDYTNEFTGLTLTFSEGSVTSTNGKAVFDSTDTWSFTDENASAFTTSSTALQITIQEISNNSLVLVFILDESIYGKVDAVAGENIFTFTR